MNTQISDIIRARDIKFDIRVHVYQALIKFTSNIVCHAHRLRKSMI